MDARQYRKVEAPAEMGSLISRQGERDPPKGRESSPLLLSGGEGLDTGFAKKEKLKRVKLPKPTRRVDGGKLLTRKGEKSGSSRGGIFTRGGTLLLTIPLI